MNTACSTSLVATAMAMDALRSGACDLALAGGVAITCPPASGYLFQDGSMASPDGHTRTFDARAGGTVAGRRDAGGQVVVPVEATALELGGDGGGAVDALDAVGVAVQGDERADGEGGGGGGGAGGVRHGQEILACPGGAVKKNKHDIEVVFSRP